MTPLTMNLDIIRSTTLTETMEVNDDGYEKELLGLLDDDDDDDDSNLQSAGSKIRRRVPLKENGKVTSLEILCPHPGFIKDLCIACGKRMNDATGVALGYIHKDLRLTSYELSRLRNIDVTSLLHRKKLYLVLDLDHTLLNSTELSDINSEEASLMSQVDSLQDISKGSLFLLRDMAMMTKLRPFVRTFLQEASKMFEMYIYTMGERSYALRMADLLDPEGLYFHSRIISQADCTERLRKGLDVVLGTQNAVLVLDDTEDVWPRDKDNLILMERYLYFSSSCKRFGLHDKSLSMLRIDENEADGALATILEVLKKIHGKFFDVGHGDGFATRDVRQILQENRKEILKNCKLVFSGFFSTDIKADKKDLWKKAEQMGATCSVQLDSTVTHVISGNAGTEKSRWAVHSGKFLVSPGWLKAAYYLWSRQPESRFRVQLLSNLPNANNKCV